MKRKVCFVITSFIHYSRNFLILEELNARADVELHVVVGGSALVQKYTSKHADVLALLKRHGFKHVHPVHFHLEGDSPVVKTKTAGLGIVEFASIFNDIEPDVVLVRADRFEVLAAAMAAAFMNITVAHIEGGDLSGTIDESVRHAITKLAHLHFTTSDEARTRVISMGEHPKSVFNVGSPDVEVARVLARKPVKQLNLATTGSGNDASFFLGQDYYMVMYHPVWSEASDEAVVAEQTQTLIRAIHELAIPTLWFWPNADFGGEIIARELRRFNDQEPEHQIRFLRYLPPTDFITLLGKANVFIGNSSAGLKECSYLGIPVVNIGARQQGRTRGEHVIDAPHHTTKIKSAIRSQHQVGRYKQGSMFKSVQTGKKVAEKLAKTRLYTQKQFYAQS